MAPLSAGVGDPNSSASDPIRSKICCLRLVFISSMGVAAAVCGATAFLAVRRLEADLGEQTHQSVAASALKGAQAITRGRLEGAGVISLQHSFQFPNASDWPFAFMKGFVKIANKLSLVEDSMPSGVGVILQLEQILDFEKFAQEAYQTNGYPDRAGVSDFGFGMWAFDKSDTRRYPDGRVHDINGTISSLVDSKYNVAAPLLQNSNLSSTSLMFNLYSENVRRNALDLTLDCAAEANINAEAEIPMCSLFSEMITLISKSGPAALLLIPVFPINDPTAIVAVAVATLDFADVLTDTVPDYVDGLYYFLSSERIPTLIGEGDSHDRAFDSYATSGVLNDFETRASTSTVYTLTIYPSKEMFEEFGCRSPWAISIGFVAVILFSASLFFFYDFFMRHESRQRKIILEVKRRFVRFVSHEILTPLNTVCLGLELLQSELKPEKERESHAFVPLISGDMKSTVDRHDSLDQLLQLTDDILENANNAVDILNDLLNYDKIQQGTFKLEIGTVHVWELVRATVSAFHIQAEKRKVSLSLKTGTQLTEEGDAKKIELNDLLQLHVVGDDTRLRQVIRNLISNSLKFSPEKTGVIEVTTEHNPKGLHLETGAKKSSFPQPEDCGLCTCIHPCVGSVLITVKDNGVGMTREQLGRLFQEGVQFEANKHQSGGGSGLGLYISKGLVEQHGGRIHIDSAGPGHGTTATVELPLYQFPLSESASTAFNQRIIVDIESGEQSSPRKKRNVLVVDDALPNRKMLVRILEKSGHTCTSACNGQEAVSAIHADRIAAETDPRHVRIDTILMDYEMPVLNGPDATRVLRESGCTAIIIGVTGNVLSEDISHFKSMGADEVLAKPIQVGRLDELWERFNR